MPDLDSSPPEPPTAVAVSAGTRVTCPPPRLLDRVRATIRALHYNSRTEEAYVAWIRRFILFHGKRHPDVLGEADVSAFHVLNRGPRGVRSPIDR